MKTDTTPSSEELIAKVLDLDAKAAGGPWLSMRPGKRWQVFDGRNLDSPSLIDGSRDNSNLIAEYRTAAPLLARRLAKTMKALEEATDKLAEVDRAILGSLRPDHGGISFRFGASAVAFAAVMAEAEERESARQRGAGGE